jgi:hypothetical protein
MEAPPKSNGERDILSAGNPAPFSRPHGVPAGDTSTDWETPGPD